MCNTVKGFGKKTFWDRLASLKLHSYILACTFQWFQHDTHSHTSLSAGCMHLHTSHFSAGLPYTLYAFQGDYTHTHTYYFHLKYAQDGHFTVPRALGRDNSPYSKMTVVTQHFSSALSSFTCFRKQKLFLEVKLHLFNNIQFKHFPTLNFTRTWRL